MLIASDILRLYGLVVNKWVTRKKSNSHFLFPHTVQCAEIEAATFILQDGSENSLWLLTRLEEMFKA